MIGKRGLVSLDNGKPLGTDRGDVGFGNGQGVEILDDLYVGYQVYLIKQLEVPSEEEREEESRSPRRQTARRACASTR